MVLLLRWGSSRLLSSLFGLTSFPGMVRPIDFTPAHLSFEEVAVHDSREVLMKFGNSSVLPVGNPQMI
jgi:hypothetical protein